MCSIRGLWLLDKSGEVLLSRKFSTVERRVRLRHETRDGENKNRKYLSYDEIAVPDNKEFSTLFKEDYLKHFHHSFSPEYPIFGLTRRSSTENVTIKSINTYKFVWKVMMFEISLNSAGLK